MLHLSGPVSPQITARSGGSAGATVAPCSAAPILRRGGGAQRNVPAACSAFTLSAIAMCTAGVALVLLVAQAGLHRCPGRLGGAGQTAGRTLYAALGRHTTMTVRTTILVALGGHTTATFSAAFGRTKVVAGPLASGMVHGRRAGRAPTSADAAHDAATADGPTNVSCGKYPGLWSAPMSVTRASPSGPIRSGVASTAVPARSRRWPGDGDLSKVVATAQCPAAAGRRHGGGTHLFSHGRRTHSASRSVQGMRREPAFSA